jgi:TPR repeat protein
MRGRQHRSATKPARPVREWIKATKRPIQSRSRHDAFIDDAHPDIGDRGRHETACFGSRSEIPTAMQPNAMTALSRAKMRRPDERSAAAAYAKALALVRKSTGRLALRECVTLLQAASKLGHAPATYALGTWYLYGRGVRRNTQRAADLFERAARDGDPDAQFDLAVSYERGVGRAQNPRKAAHWYKEAATRGDVNARYELGRCLYYGIGVTNDHKEAAGWYRRAARQGHAEAQYSLGLCYELGEGVRRNSVQSRKWYERSASQKFAPAIRALRSLG